MAFSRRDFLKHSLGTTGLLALGGEVPGFLARSMAAAPVGGNNSDTVLVVVQLSGGNDGLNTVVPFEDDVYHRSRPTLRLPPERLHRIASGLGLHPAMPAFRRLFEEGHLSVLQGVGYPDSNRDHDDAMLDWHTGAVNKRRSEPPRTGWRKGSQELSTPLSAWLPQTAPLTRQILNDPYCLIRQH